MYSLKNIIRMLPVRMYVYTYVYMYMHADIICTHRYTYTYIRWKTLSGSYGVATISRLLKIIGLFCKRAL